jgi:hypothetical protein
MKAVYGLGVGKIEMPAAYLPTSCGYAIDNCTHYVMAYNLDAFS